MSSLAMRLPFILLCFCLSYVTIINGHPTHQDTVKQIANILAAYRTHFQELKTYKTPQGSQRSLAEPSVCEICDLGAPVVSSRFYTQ